MGRQGRQTPRFELLGRSLPRRSPLPRPACPGMTCPGRERELQAYPWFCDYCLTRLRLWLATRIAPLHSTEALSLPNQQIENKTNNTDYDHSCHHQVVAAGAPGIIDEVAQAAAAWIHHDHFGGHHDQPRDAQSD